MSSLFQLGGDRPKTWPDPYAPNGQRSGERCEAISSTGQQCMRERHDGQGKHRWTSAADGRSISWE